MNKREVMASGLLARVCYRAICRRVTKNCGVRLMGGHRRLWRAMRHRSEGM